MTRPRPWWRHRGCTAAALLLCALALLATGLPQTASAATSPHPLLTGVSMESARGSYLLETGSLQLFAGQVEVGVSTNSMSFSSDSVDVQFLLTNGTPVERGTYTGSTLYLTVGNSGRGCSSDQDTLAVYDVSRDPGTGTITSFAGAYSIHCGGAEGALVGELRYHSSIDLARLGGAPLGTTTAPQTVTVTAGEATTWGTAGIEGPGASAFAISSDTCSGATVTAAATCTITVRATVSKVAGVIAAVRLPSTGGDRVVGMTAEGIDTAAGAYHPLLSGRVLDTRAANGVSTRTPIGPGGVVEFPLFGRGGVPTGGVSAVVVNLTVTSPSTGGYVTLYPSTIPRSSSSSINFTAGSTVANLVTVPLGSAGRLRAYNLSGTTHVIVDVVGYYASATSSEITTSGRVDDFETTKPSRILDTRRGSGRPIPALNAITLPLDFGELSSRIGAFAVNITAVSPSATSGYLTAWNGNTELPGTSTLNFRRGQVVANMAAVETGGYYDPDTGSTIPSIKIANVSNGTVHLVVDLVGIYFRGIDGDRGWRYRSLSTPTRIVDSRAHQGIPVRLGARASSPVVVRSPVADANTRALVANVTAVRPTSATYLTLWRNDGSAVPPVSNLNAAAGQVVANMAMTSLWTSNDLRVYNFAGNVDVVIDASGTFQRYPQVTPTVATPTVAGAKPTDSARSPHHPFRVVAGVRQAIGQG